jgi:hypothetical protein
MFELICFSTEGEVIFMLLTLSGANNVCIVYCYRGVDKFFKTLAKLAISSEFSLSKSENDWPKI